MTTPRHRARDGVRAWVRSAGSGLRSASPYAILAFLAASAAAPVAGAALGASGEMGAALGQIGGMGSNYLADSLAGTANRLRGTDPGPSQWRDEVAADLLARLDAGDDRLRDEVAGILHAVDAVSVALHEADAGQREQLIAVFGALGEDVGRLQQLGEDALRVLGEMHQAQHVQTDLLRRSLVQIALLRRDTYPVDSPPGSGPDPGGPGPYPGLESFDAEQARWFRGREALVADLLVRLGEQMLGGPPLVVVGVSGAGKSSLLRAGVLPAIGLGRLGHGSDTRPWLILTPGATPLATYTERRAALDGPVVLVVDQFEELFTQCADPAERAAFVTALAADQDALLIIAVRADFYPQCTELPEMLPMLGAGQVVCGPLTEAELRRAIHEPAAIAGLRLEPGLEDLLLADYQPGALPFLAHALRATWELRDGNTLTVAGYRETGGIRRAVADTANRIYLRLDDNGRAALRQAVLRLVTVVDDVAVRRRVPHDEADLDVLRPLIDARLVTAGEDTVEISHEALLDGWPRLAGWLVEAREEILLRQRTAQAAAEWAAAGEDPDALYRGARLEAAAELTMLTDEQRRFLAAGADAEAAREQSRRRTTSRLRRLAAGLAVALLLVAAGALVALDQRGDALASERLAKSRQYAASSRNEHFTAPLTSVRSALAAWHAAPTPEARSALLMAQHTMVLGQLGAEPGSVSVSVSPDGTLVAVGYLDGRVQLWDSRTRRQVTPEARIKTRRLVSLEFSPDGRYLTAGSIALTGIVVWAVPGMTELVKLPAFGAATWLPDSSAVVASRADAKAVGTIGSWDPRTGRLIGSLAVPAVPAALDLAVSRDGRYLAAAGAAGGQIVQRLDGRAVAALDGGVTSLGFADDGTLFSTGFSGQVQARTSAAGWKAVTLNTGPGETAGLNLAVTRNGTAIVGGDREGIVQQFTTGGRRQRLDGIRGVPYSIGLSADEQLLAIVGPTQPPQLFRFGVDDLPHPQIVNHLAFDPAGVRLATASGDRLIRIWDPRTGRALPSLSAPGDVGLVGLHYAPDGSLAASYDDNRIVVFHPDGRLRSTLRIPGELYAGVPRFSPDGALLAVITNLRLPDDMDTTQAQERDDPDVYVWDARTLGEPRQIRLPGFISIGEAFTPDSTGLLISANRSRPRAATEGTTPDGVPQDGAVWHYRTADLSEAGRADLTGAVNEVAVSPDGATVALANGPEMELRRLDGLTPAGTIGTHSADVQRIAYSPDGRMLATGTDTDTDITRLWDTTTGVQIAELRANSNQRGQIAFSPDGSMLAAGAGDWTVSLWHLDPADSVRRACAIVRAAATDGTTSLPAPCR